MNFVSSSRSTHFSILLGVLIFFAHEELGAAEGVELSLTLSYADGNFKLTVLNTSDSAVQVDKDFHLSARFSFRHVDDGSRPKIALISDSFEPMVNDVVNLPSGSQCSRVTSVSYFIDRLHFKPGCYYAEARYVQLRYDGLSDYDTLWTAQSNQVKLCDLDE